MVAESEDPEEQKVREKHERTLGHPWETHESDPRETHEGAVMWARLRFDSAGATHLASSS